MKFCLNIPFGRNCIEQEGKSKQVQIAYIDLLFYCFILFLGYQEKVLDGLQSCKNIYTYSKDSEQLKIIHFQKNSRIAPIVLEAKAGYIMITNRTPRDFVTSKDFIFQTHINFSLVIIMLLMKEDGKKLFFVIY